jgi:hypothetical protein
VRGVSTCLAKSHRILRLQCAAIFVLFPRVRDVWACNCIANRLSFIFRHSTNLVRCCVIIVHRSHSESIVVHFSTQHQSRPGLWYYCASFAFGIDCRSCFDTAPISSGVVLLLCIFRIRNRLSFIFRHNTNLVRSCVIIVHLSHSESLVVHFSSQHQSRPELCYY